MTPQNAASTIDLRDTAAIVRELKQQLHEIDEAFRRWREAAYCAGLDPDKHRGELERLVREAEARA